MSKKAFLGVDVSAATLDFALILDPTPQDFVDFQCSNNTKGYHKLVAWLDGQGISLMDCLIVMEHTGVYTLDFCMFLDQLHAAYCVCSPIDIKRSIGLQRGKSDKVDARRIASYARSQEHRLVPRRLPGVVVAKLKEATSLRSLYIRQRAALKNTLHAHKKQQSFTSEPFLLDCITKDIQHLDARIREIDALIKNIIKEDEALNKNFKLLSSITGIGPLLSALFIVYTNNFENFDDARKFMCYAGVAPFPSESGTVKKKARVSSLANKKIKTSIMSGVTSAIQHNQEIKAYYNRKIKQGKSKASARNGVAGKIISYAFAIVKRQTPFVKVYGANFLQKNVA